VYTIVRPARKIMRDVEWQGCPMKAGEMIFLPLSGACRDPQVFSDPGEVVLDRSPNNHIAFGAPLPRVAPRSAGDAHRPRGMAHPHPRLPHRRWPHHPGRGGHQLGLVSLPLVWDV
jgi:hypothetical protein